MSPELDAWIVALDDHLSQNTPRPEVPLDIRGTAFQTRVWKLLLSVREGEVVSYTELARRLGEPKAVRAVASACGRNRIAVLIPCHRVLRSDGSWAVTAGGWIANGNYLKESAKVRNRERNAKQSEPRKTGVPQSFESPRYGL